MRTTIRNIRWLLPIIALLVALTIMALLPLVGASAHGATHGIVPNVYWWQ